LFSVILIAHNAASGEINLIITVHIVNVQQSLNTPSPTAAAAGARSSGRRGEERAGARDDGDDDDDRIAKQSFSNQSHL
jgi:hypothetical protein